MEQELRVLATKLELNNVDFVGFVNQSRIPKYYAASDVFVLPSENETWGLAINEAMCAGLPIVASEEIGCVPDLVHNGVNGGTFVAKDVAGLANALRPILAEPDLRRRMGDASRDIVSRWSFTECRDGLRTALQSLGEVTMPTKVPKGVGQS
jgi:glycosyltransferase involved in cell wall biosynthesis